MGRRWSRRTAAAIVVAACLALTACGDVGAAARSAAAVSPSPSPSPSPSSSVEQRAAAVVAAMTLEERAGQVLMTAGTVDRLRSLAPLVRRYHLAGVMVRGRSGAGAASVRRALGPVRRGAPDGLPVLTATDQEGGTVQVLTGPGFARIPSAVEQARLKPAALRSAGARWGRSLQSAGVRLNLAPVADVPCATTRGDNPPVADLLRNYGTDPLTAGRQVAAFVRGMRDAGVETTVKHFPGLGCVRANTDTAARVVDRVTTPGSVRLRPFADGIDARAGFVMVSSAEYTRIDPGRPAVFSSVVIRDLLRERLGFDGVVMSDDTGGAVALRRWAPAQRVTRFIAAGGDLLLDIVPADVPVLHHAVVRRAASHPVFERRLRAAAIRVVAARLRLAEQAAR